MELSKKLLKQALLEIYPNCFYCKEKLDNINFSIDHIHPKNKGGSNGVNNLRLICRRCNSSKRTKSHIYFKKYMGPYSNGDLKREDLAEFWRFKNAENRFINISNKYEILHDGK